MDDLLFTEHKRTWKVKKQVTVTKWPADKRASVKVKEEITFIFTWRIKCLY